MATMGDHLILIGDLVQRLVDDLEGLEPCAELHRLRLDAAAASGEGWEGATEQGASLADLAAQFGFNLSLSETEQSPQFYVQLLQTQDLGAIYSETVSIDCTSDPAS